MFALGILNSVRPKLAHNSAERACFCRKKLAETNPCVISARTLILKQNGKVDRDFRVFVVNFVATIPPNATRSAIESNVMYFGLPFSPLAMSLPLPGCLPGSLPAGGAGYEITNCNECGTADNS